MQKDMIRVLRDAYGLQMVSTDYIITNDWEWPLVRELFAAGILERSEAGKILDDDTLYRIASPFMGLARECYAAFEGDHARMLLEIDARLARLCRPGQKSEISGNSAMLCWATHSETMQSLGIVELADGSVVAMPMNEVPAELPRKDLPFTQPTHRHYKGALYSVIATARHSSGDLVIYRARDLRAWARPKAMFEGNIENGALRFSPI